MVVVALIMISTLAALDAQGEAVAGRTARPVLAAVAGAAANSHEQPMLELRVVAHAALGKQNVEIARETAETLLATAGLNVEWRECGGDTCASPSEGRPSILVHLLPLAKRTNPMISGEVARDDTHTIPIVLVYVPRCDGVGDRIR